MNYIFIFRGHTGEIHSIENQSKFFFNNSFQISSCSFLLPDNLVPW